MRLKDVPTHPAYLVFHDGFDGSMEIWPCATIEWAKQIANLRQTELDNNGLDGAGIWRAYTKLPRKRVFKFHTSEVTR